MRGLLLEGGELRFRDDLPEPEACPGEVRVRVMHAGVCATDLALARGYMNFEGIPGHEFVGMALEGPLEGRPVVGDINAACGRCSACRAGMGRHCPKRTVLGIAGRPGAFAEVLRLPAVNLLPVPDNVPPEAAVFAEPLAAACELEEQLDLSLFRRARVIGDGRLGLLVAWVLGQNGIEVDLAGRHPERAAWVSARSQCAAQPAEGQPEYDLVVEATGRSELLGAALEWLAPRGTLVLKTTTEEPVALDLARVVVDELTIVGSRCGPFGRALALMERAMPLLRHMTTAHFSLENGAAAFERAGQPGALKVLLSP